MKKTEIPIFISIDDDEVFNMISEHNIKADYPDAEVHTFLYPEKGLDFLRDEIVDGADYIVLLDINMPTMTGWEVLEAIEDFDAGLKEKLRIYILYSSVNPLDKELADNNSLVSGYIEKPLNRKLLAEIMAG